MFGDIIGDGITTLFTSRAAVDGNHGALIGVLRGRTLTRCHLAANEPDCARDKGHAHDQWRCQRRQVLQHAMHLLPYLYQRDLYRPVRAKLPCTA